MGRKPRKLEVNADGTIILGIHKIPPPPKPIPAAESQEYWKQWAEKLNRPAYEEIAEIRQHLRDIVLPHLEGPIQPEQFRNKEAGEIVPATLYGVDLGNGPEVYRPKEYMLLYSSNSKIRKKAVSSFEKLDEGGQTAVLKAIDAVEELNELRVALMHLSENGSRDFLFVTAFRCGWMYKQMQMRDFEHYVRSERGRRKRRPETGARLTNDQWEIVREFIAKRVGRRDSAKAACEAAEAQLATGTLRGLEGQRIKISAKRLQNRWSKRNQ